MTDQLLDLQRDYLLDLRSVIDRLREHGRRLGDPTQFKAAFPEVLFIAHQLKGSGGSLGFPAISDVAQRLRGELNSFLEPAPPTAEQLAQQVLSLCDELERAVDSAACRGD